jgi:hypothetical protein
VEAGAAAATSSKTGETAAAEPSEVTAVGQRHRAAGAEQEESGSEKRRQA